MQDWLTFVSHMRKGDLSGDVTTSREMSVHCMHVADQIHALMGIPGSRPRDKTPNIDIPVGQS